MSGLQKPTGGIDTNLCKGNTDCLNFAQALPDHNIKDWIYGTLDHPQEIIRTLKLKAFEQQVREQNPDWNEEDITKTAAGRMGIYDIGRLVQMLGATAKTPVREAALAEEIVGVKTGNAAKVSDNFTLTDVRATKIFGSREGHLPDTFANRELLKNIAADPSTTLGADKFGNVWSGKIMSDGSQVWTQTRNGQIWNGGVNTRPLLFNPETGLSSPTRPGWK